MTEESGDFELTFVRCERIERTAGQLDPVPGSQRSDGSRDHRIPVGNTPTLT